MQASGIESFFERLNAQPNVRSCSSVFKAVASAYGFDAFACGDIDLARRTRVVFYSLDWPKDWHDYYMSSGLSERDPLLDALQHRKQAFTWTELRQDRSLPKVGTEAIRLAAERGWVEGLVIPFARGTTHYGLVSLVGREQVATKATKAFLSMAGTLFYHRVRLMAALTGFTIAPFGLTQREIDCLRLLCNGGSDRDIAAALAISRATAHGYVEAAKRKLHARTRTQALAVAIAFGLVAP